MKDLSAKAREARVRPSLPASTSKAPSNFVPVGARINEFTGQMGQFPQTAFPNFLAEQPGVRPAAVWPGDN